MNGTYYELEVSVNETLVHLLFMLPYILTIVVLLSVARRAEMPAALGLPYQREQG